MKRDQWNSRAAFVLAAIGSAAGLGNAWRFPYIVHQNGGGAFLIPYFVALFTAGIPLLVLEFSMGQKNQLGAPGALATIKEKFETFGWWTVMSAFVIVSYYAGIMGWAWNYVVGSFTGGWFDNPGAYFEETMLQVSESPGVLGGFSIPVLLGVILTWILIYLILRKGTDSVGKVVWFTVLAPVILLLVLIFRAITLPGAIEGLNYFFKPDFSELSNYKVWIDAYAQVFFTLSLGMGIMIAYASYMPEDSDITNNALITVFANSGVSFLSGVAVFSTLGFMAQEQGKVVSDVVASGPGLAFVTYPQAISELPGGALVIGFFGVVFFLMLLTLGIDSTFSLVESNVAAFVDKFGWNKRNTTRGVIFMLFLVGLLFSTKAGLHWLDIVDHYINSYGLIIGGILQTIAVGWFLKTENLRDYINTHSEYRIGKWWNFMIKFLVPAVLLYLLISNFIGDISQNYGDYDLIFQWLGGWNMLQLVLFASVILTLIRGRSTE